MSEVDQPFMSEPTELAYQALRRAGVDCTRDQFRPAIQAFVTAEAASRRAYEAFVEQRAQRERREQNWRVNGF